MKLIVSEAAIADLARLRAFSLTRIERLPIAPFPL